MMIKWLSILCSQTFKINVLRTTEINSFIEYELEIEKHAWFYEVLHFTIWLFKCHKLFVKDLLTGIYRHTQQFFIHVEYWRFMWIIYM